jgi:hypothetical protein
MGSNQDGNALGNKDIPDECGNNASSDQEGVVQEMRRREDPFYRAIADDNFYRAIALAVMIDDTPARALDAGILPDDATERMRLLTEGAQGNG